jgi:hypothetical protein
LKILFEDLRDFPSNLETRLYSNHPIDNSTVFQGDGLRDLPVIFLPEVRVEPFPSIVISNTCDISSENDRVLEPKILYCPIIRISRFLEKLEDGGLDSDKIQNFLVDLKRQRISSLFFLPRGGELPEDCVALLDSICNARSSVLPVEPMSTRIFSLSNYGFYLLLFKLSIHFTRIREAVDRG